MSTRAGIVLIDESGDTLHFYRHSDGYPKGTMPTLRKFLNLVKKGQIRDNVSQAGGWLVLIGAMEYNHALLKTCTSCGNEGDYSTAFKWNSKKSKFVCRKCGETEYTVGEKELPLETVFDPKKKEKSRMGMGWKVGAYEPTTNVKHHWDLAYIYTVDLKEKTITVHNGGSQNFSIKKKVKKTA